MKTATFSTTNSAHAAPPLDSTLRPQNETAAELARIKHWCLARADEWFARGEKGATFEFLKHASEIDPQDARVWIALGSLHYELGRLEKAGLAFVRAGQLQPENASIYLQLGLVHQQLDQRDQAEHLFHHALRLEPDHLLGLGLLATLLITSGRYADARLYVERALTLQPDDIENLLRLGACCYHMSDTVAAAKCYERVLKIQPGHALATENLNALNSAPIATVAA